MTIIFIWYLKAMDGLMIELMSTLSLEKMSIKRFASMRKSIIGKSDDKHGGQTIKPKIFDSVFIRSCDFECFFNDDMLCIFLYTENTKKIQLKYDEKRERNIIVENGRIRFEIYNIPE